MIEPFEAQVIRAAFQQGGRHRPAHGLADQRQVTVVKLILQRLRAGRDDRFAPAEQRRQEVRKRFPGARAGLHDERVQRLDAFGHRFGHPRLPGTRLKTGQQRRQRAFGPKKFGKFGHRAKVTRLTTR